MVVTFTLGGTAEHADCSPGCMSSHTIGRSPVSGNGTSRLREVTVTLISALETPGSSFGSERSCVAKSHITSGVDAHSPLMSTVSGPVAHATPSNPCGVSLVVKS